ncbi:SDR family oxidoreductase [Ohtaekwangia koreensis]|uniref:NAD(P)-dependent dehydrogenase, short-chain alcohol dehydrogenase family n=1 Tax=Ohtaekwangia koreensis TaxID=688867 RepID=A0A1T5MCJ1_9BACT|nr:SDR family oxidoreductase [Ohtaekwangia koreensis]SKC85930.1 NAD(P)-dependent dehydrogenase, short-chain alcohol dehydrogenase family [Ohtaekwangia koreensis]
METTLIKDPADIKPQHQDRQPGIESEMSPRPIYDTDDEGYGRLRGKVAIITGGDSGIGRAVAIQFAKEGADVAIAYLDEHEDAQETADAIRKYGKEALLISTDVSQEVNCKNIVDQTLEKFKHIDILVNNAAVQYEQKDVQSITAEQWEYTFRVNIFAYFYMVKYTVPYLRDGCSIVNTASVTAYKGNQTLMDYSSTKGAIIAFTRSLSQSLAEKGIRVNAVAPGPVWTPLIPASFDDEKVEKFGKDVPLGRPAQPVEIATSYVFLASKEGSFFTGQVLHPNGGSIINT